MDYQLLTQLIIELIGGERNLLALELKHATLILQLKKPNQVQTDSLSAINHILSMTCQDQQLRLGLGPHARQIYLQLLTQTKLVESAEGTAQAVPQNRLSQMIDVFTDLFQPLIYVLIGAGITKGTIDTLIVLSIIPTASITTIVLQTLSNSLFYFLPIFIAATAAQRFKTDQFVAMTIAASLVYPGILQLVQLASPELMGFTILSAENNRGIWPIVVCVYLCSILGRRVNQRFHNSFRNLLTPFTLLVVMVPITLLISGPLLNSVQQLIADWMDISKAISPLLQMGILASTWHLLHIIGIGLPLSNVSLSLVQNPHSGLALALILAIFSQSGAILGVWLKTCDPRLKQICAGSMLASLLGISSPGIYAVTLRYKTPFLCAMIAAMLGAVTFALLNMLLLKHPEPLLSSKSYWPITIAATAVSMVCATLLSYWSYRERQLHGKAPHQTHLDTIYAPLNGQLNTLEQLNDGLFSIGVMGQGVAIVPTDPQLRAPIDGSVTQIDSHSLTLSSHAGIELLIQIGLGNNQLDEPGLIAHCQVGDSIQRGQLLAELPLSVHLNEAQNLYVPIVITNSENYYVTYPDHQITDTTPNQVIMTVN